MDFFGIDTGVNEATSDAYMSLKVSHADSSYVSLLMKVSISTPISIVGYGPYVIVCYESDGLYDSKIDYLTFIHSKSSALQHHKPMTDEYWMECTITR